jgi:hypothetical protein
LCLGVFFGAVVVHLHSDGYSPPTLQEPNFISSSIMAFSPYRSLHGENFVALGSLVLCDHITFGSSSAHLPLQLFIFIKFMVLMTTSST